MASELRMALLMGSGLKLTDAVDDRRWDGWIKERTAKPVVTIDGEHNGMMAFSYNGRQMVVPTHVLGGMAGAYANAQARQKEAAAPQGTGGAPTAPAVPLGAADTVAGEGKAISKGLSAIGSFVTQPPANSTVPGAGRIATER